MLLLVMYLALQHFTFLCFLTGKPRSRRRRLGAGVVGVAGVARVVAVE